MLILYTKDGCQYCSIVKQELAKMDIEYEERNVAEPQHRDSLISVGGEIRVPFLIDDKSGVAMYDSMLIIDYLRKTYS